ncbi:MAG: hypothetical protein QW461_09965 [Candidatus Jordarchaeales archaeon]
MVAVKDARKNPGFRGRLAESTFSYLLRLSELSTFIKPSHLVMLANPEKSGWTLSGEYIAGLEKRTESFSGKLEGAFDPLT